MFLKVVEISVQINFNQMTPVKVFFCDVAGFSKTLPSETLTRSTNDRSMLLEHMLSHTSGFLLPCFF